MHLRVRHAVGFSRPRLVQTSGAIIKLSTMEERIVRFRARTILAVLGIVLAVVALLQVLWLARQVLTWVLIAVFLALALDPFVSFLMRRGIRRRGLAIGTAYLIVAGLVVLVGATFVPTLVNEVRSFVDAVPNYVEDLTKGRGRLGFLERDYQVVERVRDALSGVQFSRILGVSGTAVAVTRGVITAIVATITIIVLTFFMLLEGPLIIERVLGLVPEDRRPRWQMVGRQIYATIGGYVAGALTIALVAGVTTAILLSVLSVSYAIALALVVAITDLIPLAGATIGAVIVSTVAFLDRGLTVGLIVVVVFIVYQQVENHVLYPLVYSRTIALSPLTILIAVLIGASLAGVLGALAAIPIAGTIQVLLTEWLRGRREGTLIAEAPL
jgi:predicted PurR-regulated permease PerM